ncbi:pilus assembly protein CpaE [Candidatus Hamiltonella endosymbiont of Tuberolachnus salignus]|uniref:pilus assembly protein CpaE n=1 Tax=Candidatus Williamhamiltonella endosymbiont of Tuberolachnus salignus TaxID=3077954 RepID=UPI0030CB0AFE
MSLFLSKNSIHSQNNQRPSENLVAILSKNTELSGKISDQVYLSGIQNIKEMSLDFSELTHVDFPDALSGVILDIGSHKDVDFILNFVQSQIPSGAWCVLVGSNDSIRVAQQFTEQGLLYLHADSQITELTQHLIKGISIKKLRNSFLISVLGCRGGVGSSLLSYQLAQSINELKNSLILLSQGKQGSQDIDLITESKIGNTVFNYQKNLDILFLGEKSISNIEENLQKKYHFIIFDQPIYLFEREDLEKYINHSHVVVLVLDHSMTSVRVAKNFINIFERFKKNNQKSTRIITCVNENRPKTKDMFAIPDIESLLERSIDIKIPYIKNAKNFVHSPYYYEKHKKNLLKLSQSILGLKDIPFYLQKGWLTPFLKMIKK